MIATSRTPIAAAAIPILPLVLVFWMRDPIYLDLCVEDVGFGLDGLGSNLRGQLHRKSCALHRHDHRRGVRGRPGGARTTCDAAGLADSNQGQDRKSTRLKSS